MILCVAAPSIFIKTDSVKCRCWRPSLSGLTSHFYSVISIRETACKSGVTAVMAKFGLDKRDTMRSKPRMLAPAFPPAASIISFNSLTDFSKPNRS